MGEVIGGGVGEGEQIHISQGRKEGVGIEWPGQAGAPLEHLRPRFSFPGRKCVSPGATSRLTYEFKNFKTWDSFWTAVGAGRLGDFAYMIERCFIKEILAPSQHFGSPSKQPVREFRVPQTNKGWFLGEGERTALLRLDFLFGSLALLWTHCFLSSCVDLEQVQGEYVKRGKEKRRKEKGDWVIRPPPGSFFSNSRVFVWVFPFSLPSPGLTPHLAQSPPNPRHSSAVWRHLLSLRGSETWMSDHNCLSFLKSS